MTAKTEAPVAPQDLDAEESVLGAMMLSPGAIDSVRAAGLEAGDFYRHSHGLIFDAIAAVRDSAPDARPDAVLVVDELERRGQLEDIGGRVRIHELAALVPAAANAGHYARIVQEMASLREQISLGLELQSASYDHRAVNDVPALRDRLRLLLDGPSARSRIRVHTFGELLDRYQAERSDQNAEPVRLGFGSIDRELRGVSPGFVCGFAARTAVGKTWFLNSVLETFSARRDAGALAMSLEMPGPEWAERQLAIHANVAPEQVEGWAREGVLAEQAQPFLERMQHVLVADEPTSLEAMPRLFAEAQGRLGDVPLRLVAIDYLGLLGSPGRNVYEQASAVGKGLKLTAKQEQVAIVVAMQLSRAAGDGSEPVSIAHLRDSGVLEESVDFLLGAWRPEKAANLNPDEAAGVRDVLRVAILKNRNGVDGRVVDLRFRGRSRRVYEPTTEPVAP